MANTKKSNITSEKPEKVYLKDIAARSGMSARAFRNAGYMAHYIEIIKQKLQSRPDLLKQFNMVIANSSRKAKKQGISYEEYKVLSELPEQELYEIIESFKETTGNYKAIVQEKILDHEISVNIKLSASANSFYKLLAEKEGISKSKFISRLLTEHYVTSVLQLMLSDSIDKE